MTTLKSLLIATPVVFLLDFVWVGMLMASFYQSRLRPLLNFVDGKLDPNIAAAALTYAVMIMLVVFVAVPLQHAYNVQTNIGVFVVGAVVGLLAYALYNFTNLALLREWSLLVTVVDILWGGLLFGLSTLAVKLFS